MERVTEDGGAGAAGTLAWGPGSSLGGREGFLEEAVLMLSLKGERESEGNPKRKGKGQTREWVGGRPAVGAMERMLGSTLQVRARSPEGIGHRCGAWRGPGPGEESEQEGVGERVRRRGRLLSRWTVRATWIRGLGV